MSFYPVSSRPAIPGVEIPGGDQAAAQAVMVAVPVSALVWPVRAGSGRDGRSALLVAGAEPVTAGEPVAWCKVVVTAPAVLRRDGLVQAEGRPCDHARLGAAEQELDRRCGPGTIERIAAGVRPTGKIKAATKVRARREMSVACTIRAVLLMTLMPDADSREVLTTLLGELTAVPWQRAHAVPSGTVLSTWRAAIGEAPLQQLQRELLAAVGAEHRADGLPTVEVGGGLRLGSIDGTVTRMPDTRANRAAFGTAGQAETGYPQIRHLHASDALTRATLAVVCGPAGGDKAGTKGEAEQALLDRMLTEHPDVFGSDRLWIMDRNFPGVPRIAAMLATGSHVLIRVKSDIRLPRISPFADDGSYLARLSGGGATLTMRVVEYHITLDGATTPESFCLVTDLLDHHTHPPRPPAGPGLSVAVGRIRDRAARGQVDHPRRRTRHRGEPALGQPGADPAGTRRLDRRHRARPRRHPLGRRHRRTVPEGSPHRTGRRGPAPVVHHRSPHPDRHRAGRDRHRLTPRSRPGRRPPHRPGRDRHRAGHHRPAPPPRPQNQIQAVVLLHPPQHHHPHRPRPRARLRHHGGLTPHRRVPRSGLPRARNPAHPARQPGRRHAPRPLSLSVDHSKITTRVRGSANYLISLALDPPRSAVWMDS